MWLRWLTIFLDLPGDAFDAAVAFWREVTGCGLSESRGAADEFATLLPPSGDAYLRVQRVFDGAGGCHLDLHVDPAAGSLEDAAAGALALGARLHDHDDEVIIADSPGGFTFCLVPWEGETKVPAPLAADGAGASRADQLCLDIPPAQFELECAFWAALTGWDLRQGQRPEYAFLKRPGGMPARLLLQRRESAAPGDRVSAHVDFGCADRERLAAWHVARGARIVTPRPYWTVMADPTGRPYCLTVRDPVSGELPAAGPRR